MGHKKKTAQDGWLRGRKDGKEKGPPDPTSKEKRESRQVRVETRKGTSKSDEEIETGNPRGEGGGGQKGRQAHLGHTVKPGEAHHFGGKAGRRLERQEFVLENMAHNKGRRQSLEEGEVPVKRDEGGECRCSSVDNGGKRRPPKTGRKWLSQENGENIPKGTES